MNNNENLKFWVTCPYCRKKFGTSPELIFKYLDRIMPEIEKGPDRWADKIESAKQEQANPRG